MKLTKWEDLTDEQAAERAAEEQYDKHPTIEDIGYWQRVGAEGGTV